MDNNYTIINNILDEILDNYSDDDILLNTHEAEDLLKLVGELIVILKPLIS